MLARADGQQEDAGALVVGLNVGSCQQPPPSHPPVFGQLVDNPTDAGFESLSSVGNKKPSDVFEEEQPGPSLSKYAARRGPEVPFVREQLALSGEGMALTGDAGDDKPANHVRTEEVAREGLDRIPDRRDTQGRVFHPRHESGRCVGFPLDVHQRAGVVPEPLQGGVGADIEHPAAGAKADDVEGT